MGSLGLTATTMAVRSAFALLCFALLCGLAASSGFQSETETELRTKIEGEAAGNQVLGAQAVESRVARGSNNGKKNKKTKACEKNPNLKKCQPKQKKNGNRKNRQLKRKKSKTTGWESSPGGTSRG